MLSGLVKARKIVIAVGPPASHDATPSSGHHSFPNAPLNIVMTSSRETLWRILFQPEP